jgi:predicted site-specific integrase-resolvase
MLSISEAAALLGVATGTLRRWERQGIMEKIARTPGQHRRYTLPQVQKFYELHGKKSTSSDISFHRKTICYARVSGHDQKSDLDTQAQRLEEWATQHKYFHVETIKDLGSGLNFEKKGLKKLLHMIFAGQVSALLISHKDRLLRFGSELIFSICDHMNVEVKILEEENKILTDEELLARDVIQLMTVFCAKLHGKRSHSHAKKKAA